MPIVSVVIEERSVAIPFHLGDSLQVILSSAGLQISSACGGQGRCGLCRVRIIAGNVATATPQEQQLLSSAQLVEGVRLACQLTPEVDLTISEPNLAPLSQWRPLSAEAFFPIDIPVDRSPGLGVAVDLGTTQIRISLWNMGSGQRITGCSALNPQACYGADVLNRLTLAMESDADAQQLKWLAWQSLAEGLREISLAQGVDLSQVSQLRVVANTAMLCLLSGRDYRMLLDPDNWTREFDFSSVDFTEECAALGLTQRCEIAVTAPLAGFVGSDLLAGVLASRICDGPAGSLFIDFGTNTEIALWDGKQLWVTSVPGGPAFEGSGISCGMPAELGAVYQLECDHQDSQLKAAVIGSGEVLGVCGSGLVDMIACLVVSGIIKGNGRFSQPLSSEGYSISLAQGDICLNKRDVDALQRAKAATAAGYQYLMKVANIQIDGLSRACVCGAFGRFLNVVNAQSIGLLPLINPEHIELFDNAALAGCEQLLLTGGSDQITQLKQRSQIINMSLIPEFEELFIKNLYLKPMANV